MKTILIAVALMPFAGLALAQDKEVKPEAPDSALRATPEAPAALATVELPMEKCTSCPALSGCAQSLQAVTDAYKAAYEGFQKWTEDSSARVSGLQAKSEEMRGKIQENEAAITKLKLDGSKAAKAKLKELEKENKGLWKSNEGIEKQKKALCGEISKATAQKVKEFNKGIGDALSSAQAGMK
ncbi:MAG: hypothetical protein WC728_06305 [Elusimicrobiota bacterium]